MRLNHPTIPIGLLITGVLVLGVAGRIESAAAASDCPCIRSSAGTCVPDLVCEARERQMHNRLMHTTRARSLRPAADTAAAAVQPGPASSGGRLRILETGYSHLSELGKEDEGYGLYSYAILPSESRRAEIFLSQLFKEIPSIYDTSARRSQLNIFYVPLKKDREREFATLIRTSAANFEKMGEEYSRSFYDYRIARALLDHVCNQPADNIRKLCDGDLSRGPYIFTYASPASSMSSVPPPFLFVDLSNVHAQAFGELIAAFRSQLKRDDISDQVRIRTLRLMILDIALTAADWVNPVEKAIADIVHSPSADEKK